MKHFKKMNLLIVFVILMVLVSSCSKDSSKGKDILREFEDTLWESGKGSIYLEFFPDTVNINIKVSPSTEPSDINLEGFDLEKYKIGTWEDISIEKQGKDNIKIFNDDISLEFEIISDNEIKDSDGNIFKKR